MHPPHSAVFCNKGKALSAREKHVPRTSNVRTSHPRCTQAQRPEYPRYTRPRAQAQKGQCTPLHANRTPRHCSPCLPTQQGHTIRHTRSAYSHTLVSHTLVCPTPTPCPTQHVLDRTNYDAVLLHTPQRNPTPGQQRPPCHLVRQASRHPPPLTCHTLTCRNTPF
jgi:hypothetical protein